MLSIYGWSPVRADQFEEWRTRGCVPARVLRQEYGSWLIQLNDREHWVRHARRGLSPITGDWLAVRSTLDCVEAILPRQSLIERKAAGKRPEPQALASNVDLAFIVMGLDHDYNLARLERYLILVESSGARACILLNKRDRHPAPDACLAATQAVSRDAPVILLSALQDNVAEALSGQLATGETAALLGSSGAGKSTITNRILGSNVQLTQEVREDDSHGRHTTTRRELHLLPQGWLLMDLPGLREVMPWTDEPVQVRSSKLQLELEELREKRAMRKRFLQYRDTKSRW
ncbi:GTPase RsgA [uncultured Paludibaculum sp.]|uniref:GTPase RsgA n=1 Tax=uncultured Paludibaculum sp. TaxID=1765020 RepID=UPI002AABAB9A|nr:GTPase RsgA [uncultured Paludibaculum sp.]